MQKRAQVRKPSVVILETPKFASDSLTKPALPKLTTPKVFTNPAASKSRLW